LILSVCYLQSGCCPFADLIDQFFVNGILVLESADAPLSGAAVGGRLLTGGVVTAEWPAVRQGAGGVDVTTPTGEDGAFELFFLTGGPLCASLFGPTLPPPEIPMPDQIEIIVVREDCEQSILIDVNDSTIVDLTAPDDTLELREPVFVPPCPE